MLSTSLLHRNWFSTPSRRGFLLQAALGPPDEARAAYAAWRACGPASLSDLAPSERSFLPLLSPRVLALTDAEDERESIRSAFREAWARNLRLVTAAAPAVEALRAAGVPVVLLKGAALAFSRYASHGLRPMNDVDLLVPARAAAAARRVLGEAGYHPAVRHADGFLDSIHGLAFLGPEGLEVDLHWHTLLERPSDAADAILFEDASPLSIPGLSALAPSPEGHLLLVAVHAQRWSAVPHLVGFADTVVLLGGSRENRLVTMVAAARELGLLSPLARTLATVEAALPGTVPPCVTVELEREEPSLVDRLEALLRRRPPGLLSGLALHWLAHRGANPDATAGERLASFPARMRHVWGIAGDANLAAEALRRASSRIGPGRGTT
ncbi:MAG: nucleotidyltransferase family protein [Thermoanaerobaculia bacterium]|nr:nucleotidyltransferase family protein [Thermoanaerobaculia bacterium]